MYLNALQPTPDACVQAHAMAHVIEDVGLHEQSGTALVSQGAHVPLVCVVVWLQSRRGNHSRPPSLQKPL